MSKALGGRASLPIDVAAAKHQAAAKAEAQARAELYEVIREQVRQGMPVSHAAARAGITRVTVARVLRTNPTHPTPDRMDE